MQTEIEKLIHVKTAAQILCCTTAHIYNLIRDDQLEAVRLGPRGLRIKKKSVDLFIENNTVDPDKYFE